MAQPLPPLYPLTDGRQGISLEEQIHRLGAAGYPLVQFRGKPLDPLAQWNALRAALQTAAAAGGWPAIVVNDRADLAVLAAQEGLTPWGLHLGQEDLPPSEARGLPGLGTVHLGTSTHGPEEWAQVDSACDHAGVGPVRATVSKGDHAPPIGWPGLEAGCAQLRAQGVAPVAIGGLRETDLPQVFAAGAEAAAMVGEVAAASDPTELLWQAQMARWRARPPISQGSAVVLAGGSGSGKSTLGAVLAHRLGLPFVDGDAALVAETGRDIPALFASEGEAAFRELEMRLACRALERPCVLALGGGAWEHPELREAVVRHGAAAFWLAEVPETAWKRVAGDPNRPLAQDRAEFLSRFRQRMAAWSRLPCILPLGRPPEFLAEALLQACPRFASLRQHVKNP